MLVTPLSRSDDGQREPEPGADDDADHGAEERDDHRLRADHRPHLPPFHPDGAQQSDLVRALEHRQHERVDDPDQRDQRSASASRT